MGLREKVTITLVIIALAQIACRHCMPRTPSKASLKRYLNDLKPVKNNPVSTPYSPSKVNKTPKQTFGKTAQNGRLSQNSLTKKSLFDTYNFPENEYPLDNAPRDRFRTGMNVNDNNQVNTLQKARNLQSSAISDLKKEIKMKRKLLSNKQVNNEKIPSKTDISSIQIASNLDSVRLLDSETFPQVQYPLNTMETWGQNYWNYLPFTQEKQLNGLGQQTLNLKARDGINKPFTRLTKAKASKFLQSYDKLKEEQRRTSTENSKRSNVGQKGLNFTKTATCERVTDDFITAGLLSNTLGNPSDMKTLDSSTKHIANSAENTCPLIDISNYPMPLPYKVIEGNIENVCPAFELKNNTQELEDEDSSVIAKTLQLIEEILLSDDTSLKVPLKTKNQEKEDNVKTTEADYTDDSAKEAIPINLIENAENSTVIPIEDVSDDAQAHIMTDNLPSLPEETITENPTTVTGPLSVRMPLPFTEPVTNGGLTNTPMPDLTNMTGYTSIIIIPMNNDSVGESHMFDTTSDTPIIVYLPSTQLSSIPSQTPPFNQIVSTSLGNLLPNNQLYNVLSNMAPVQNDNPSSTALVSELPNSISESGSSLPMHETLPTNSMNYNNENSPSSMREKPVSDCVIHKSFTDVVPFVTPSCSEKLSQQPVETDENPDTLPQTSDIKHPFLDFADSDPSLSHGPNKNVLNNELPIIAREIDLDQHITKTDSKYLLIATQNITTGHLHKMTSLDSVFDDSLSESPNGVPTVALIKNMSSETPTDSQEIFKNLHDSNLPVFTEKSISPSPISKQNNENPQPINEMPPTLLVDTPIVQLPTPTELSLKPTTTVSEITSDSAPQSIDNTLVPSPILNETPMTTDLTVKMELYKIRQILDRMLLSETGAVNQPPTMDTTLSSIPDTDSLPLLEEQSLSPIQAPTDRHPPPLDNVLSPIPDTESLPLLEEQLLSPIPDTESLPLLEVQPLSPIETPTDRQPAPLEKVLSPIPDTKSLPLLEEQSLSPIQAPTDRHPPPLDNVLSPIPDTESLPLLEEQLLSPIPDTESLPLLEVQPLSPIETPTDRQPPPLEKVLSPIPDTKSLLQTPTDRHSPPLDKALLPILDTDTLPLVEEQTLLPLIETSTDSQPLLDKLLSPISGTDSVPLLAGDKTLLPLPVTNKPIGSLQLQDHQTLLKTPIDDGSKDTIPSPMDKSVLESTESLAQPLDGTVPLIPLFETTIDNKPYLIDNLVTPLHETVTSRTKDISNNDLAHKMDNLPLKMGLEFPDIYEVYDVRRDSPMDVIEIPDLLSKTPVSDLLRPAEVLTLPVEEVVEIASPSLPSDSDTSLLSDSIDNVYQDFPPYKDPSEGLPALPLDKFKSPNHEVMPNRQLHEISSEIQPQKYDLPLSVDKLIPDISHSDDLSNKPSIIEDSPSPETDNILNFTADNKNPLSYNRWLSPEDDASSDTLPTDIPIAAQQSTYLNKTSDAILSGPTLSDLHRENLLLPSNKALPLSDNTLTNLLPSNKSLSSSKLPITKALLENVLSDITKGVFSSQVAKALPVTPPSDKTVYYVDEKSPPSDTKDVSLENSLPNAEYNENLIDNLLVSQITEDTPTTDLPSELPLPMDKIYNDKPEISTDAAKGENEKEVQTSDHLSDDQPLPNDTIFAHNDSGIPRNKKISSSELPITKALLETVLSEINTKGFSIPVSKALPATSSLALNKTDYFIDSPHPDFADDSPPLPEDKILTNTAHTDNNLPLFGQSEDTLTLEEDKTLSEIQSIDIPTENSSPMDKILSNYELPSPVTEIPTFPNDTPSDSQLPSYKNKTPSSSKLPIAKALLENVLSDINSKGFSIPVAKLLRGTSRSQLDKTLYFLENSRPDTTAENSVSDVPTENDHYSEINEVDFPLSADKVVTDYPILNIPTDESSGKINENILDDLTEEVEDSYEALFSEELADDFLSEMEKPLSLDDMPEDLIVPLTKQLFSSRLPITKALLERVLSDLTEGAIAANNLLNQPNV